MRAKPNSVPSFTASRSQLLRINDVVALTTLSKSCVALWVAQGRFPSPIALSSTLKVWRCSDVADWIDKQFEVAEGKDLMQQSGGTAFTARTARESK
jgi:predicted DNA-binding transcriptional regulator AlpA